MGKVAMIVVIVVFLYLVSLGASYIARATGGDKIAVIHIEGQIGTTSSIPLSQEGVTAESIQKFMKAAEDDKSVKGILLDINSPGGTVVASREIARSVESAKKPVVAVIRDIGTSGAYWIASAADKIVADELSITGSVGVTASYLDFADLLKTHGVTYNQLSAGENKEVGSPLKKLSQQERSFIEEKMKIIQQTFIDDVAQRRRLSEESVNKIADGSYFLGREAYALGLIDVLGGKNEAIKAVQQLASIPEQEEPIVVEYQEERGLLDLVSKLETQAFTNIGRGIASHLQATSFIPFLAK